MNFSMPPRKNKPYFPTIIALAPPDFTTTKMGKKEWRRRAAGIVRSGKTADLRKAKEI